MNDFQKGGVIGFLIAGVAFAAVGGVFLLANLRERKVAPVRNPAMIADNSAEAWLPLLNSTNLATVAKALTELNARGQPPAELVPKLMELCRDRRFPLRARALFVLGKAKVQVEQVVPLYIELLKDGDQRVREYSISNLAALGSLAADAIPAMIEMLKVETSKSAQDLGFQAMGRIASMPEIAVPFLIESLESSRVLGRRAVIIGIGGYGSDARKAIPHLQAAAAQDPSLRQEVENALYRIK